MDTFLYIFFGAITIISAIRHFVEWRQEEQESRLSSEEYNIMIEDKHSGIIMKTIFYFVLWILIWIPIISILGLFKKIFTFVMIKVYSKYKYNI